VIFRFLPGTYTSNSTGIWMVSGWQFLGSGQGTTTLRFPSVNYASAARRDPNRIICLNCNWGSNNITIQDLTVDGGVRDGATPVGQSFIMPDAQQSVTISVPEVSKLSVGKWYYVQDTVMTNNIQEWWGVVVCTAIQGHNVTLRNAQINATGTFTGDLTAGSTVVKNVSSLANVDQASPISCSALPNGVSVYVATIDSATQVTLDQPAAATSSHATLTYGKTFTGNVSGPVLATAALIPAVDRAGMMLQSCSA
jgi:hypothetical protein